jgi:hypothetical protein
MTVPELLKRRRYEQVMGVFFSVMSVALMFGGMVLFESFGSFYGLIVCSTGAVTSFIVVLDCSQNLNTMGLHIRIIKEHEK